MKTEIKTFCNGYAEALAPFAKTLNQALDEMPDGAGDSTLNEWRLRLREVAHRTDGLLDKLEQQQAYLLIFGPLKSGKSTLMNAVSGAYVSEVSSLPAYPALVYVKHGEKRRFRGTRYSGEAVDFEDHEAMSKAMSGGHAELANKILEAEKAGESFDPHRHYPEAIRRLDVETPAPALVDSGSALVDTPGLYTRMRFGYDVMTRDFRDTASCAIFVVKSDNLFFEKVFEEFNDLLGHFSRIFLVVNIDGSKRDLSPNGSLEPSLESREPSAIIEAFQSLAMSAPLRQAYDEGRLNVYPIDLLSAASRQLSRQAESGGAEALDAESKEDEEERQDGFSTFLGDLTSYLNSSDYFREFMGDSVRVGESLASEVKAVVETEAALKLNADADGWSRRLNDTKERRHALKVLDTIDWKSAFARAAEEKDRALEEQSEKDHSALGQHLSDALDRWLDSDDTLRGLRDDYLNPLIGRATAEESNAILKRLRGVLDTATGGARFTEKEREALRKAGLSLDEIAAGLRGGMEGGEAPVSPRLELKPEDIPLKRSFSDWALFRKGRLVRERFFGSDGTEFVSSARKHRRISGKALQKLRDMVMAYPERDLPELQRESVERVFEGYVDQLVQALKRQRDELDKELAERAAESEAMLKAIGEAQKVFERLSSSNKRFWRRVEELKSELDPELLNTKVEAGEDENLAIDGQTEEKLREQISQSVQEIEPQKT